MLNDRDRRIRRATLKAVPRDATVDTDTLQRDLRRALAQLSTEFSTSPIDNENGLFYSQLEILAHRTAAGDLEYRLSYVHPRDPREMETGETAVGNAFEYATLTGFARWELADFFPTPLLSPETATAYSLIPTPDSGQTDPTVTPGADLAAIIQALDQTPAEWGIQVLLSRAPRLASRSQVGMEIRIVTADQEEADHAEERPATDPVTALTAVTESTAMPLDLRTWDASFPSLFAQGVMRRDRTTPVPVASATGYCPVPRQRAIRIGIGGTVSGLETGPLEHIQNLAQPSRVLGVESPVDATGPITDVLPLGLPAHATSVLSVVHEDTLTAAVGQTLKQHVTTHGPTFVITNDSALVTACAKRYCHITATNAEYEPALPEHVTSQRLSAFLNSDRITELRPWFEDLLDSDDELYLIDLADTDPQAVGEQAALLLGELSNAADTLSETDQSTPHVGNVLVAVPELVEHSNPQTDTVETALRITQTTGLGLDVITTYDTATDTGNDETVRTLGQSADAIIADNTGPAARFVTTDHSPAAQRDTAERLNTTATGIVDIARINRNDTLTQPVVLPLLPLHVTSYYTNPENLQCTKTQRNELATVLNQLSTVAVPTVGAIDAATLPVGATTQAATATSHNGHVPRRTGLPPSVEYDEARECYTCLTCLPDDGQNATRRDATNDGLRLAIECCSSLDDVDRHAVRRMPSPTLKLTAEEIDASNLQRKHLTFLKGLYLVETEQVHPYFEYDPLIDSGVVIRDDYNLTADDIELLKQHGYISKDIDPHVLYTLTSDGRHLLNEPWREGHEHGPYISELNDTLQHQTFVRAATLDYKHRYGDDPDLHIQTFVPVEVPTPDGTTTTKNIDVAVVDDDGNIIHATEAERENHDQPESIQDTYQKLVAAEPTTARWLVSNQTTAANVFTDLATEAAKGTINYSGTTYSTKTAIRDMNPDEPGITDIETIRTLKADLENIPAQTGNLTSR